MPRRSNDFQRLITFLEQQLAPTGACVTPSAMLQPTDNGPPREIDILIEHAVGPHAVKVAIECRAHKRRQGTEWIEAIAGKYEHLPVHKIIAVSKSGFTKSAEDAAAHRNFATVTLQQALDVDWPQEVARYRIGLVAWEKMLKAVEVNYRDGPKLAISGNQLLLSRIEDSQGKSSGTFKDDVDQLLATFVGADVLKWAQQNAQEIFKKEPGYVWELTFAYTARNRFLVSTADPKREINDVILFLACRYRVDSTDLGYFRYLGSLVGSGHLEPPDDPNRYSFALLLDDSGKPKALNVHWEPKARSNTR